MLKNKLSSIPSELAGNLENEFKKIIEHFRLGEWDDLEVDGGRFAEAALRYLELKTTGKFTPVDGRSKPNRKMTVNTVRQDKRLPASLRAQVPDMVELIMDFRNNRNSAHLGSIDPGKIDGAMVAQLSGWVLAEIVRLESGLSDFEIQGILDDLAERPIAIVYEIDGQPIVLDPTMSARNVVLVLLDRQKSAPNTAELFKWTGYRNASLWRKNVIGKLVKDKCIFTKDDKVYILPPGIKEAEKVLQGGLA